MLQALLLFLCAIAMIYALANARLLVQECSRIQQNINAGQVPDHGAAKAAIVLDVILVFLLIILFLLILATPFKAGP